jgi:phage tail sheath protein FI
LAGAITYGYFWASSNQPLLGVIGLERPLTARIDDDQSGIRLPNLFKNTTSPRESGRI